MGWMQPGQTGGTTGQSGGMGGGISALGAGAGGIAQLIKGLMGMFGGHGKNPATEANNTLNQIPGATQPYYKPYGDAGRKALEDRVKRYGENPTDVYNNLGKGYTESPGYKYQMQQAMNAANQSAASGGMSGTPLNVANAQETAQGLASKDYENYINHVTGIYNEQGKGLTDITHQGQTADSNYADKIESVLGKNAANIFAGTEWENAAKEGDWASILQAMPWLATAIGLAI